MKFLFPILLVITIYPTIQIMEGRNWMSYIPDDKEILLCEYTKIFGTLFTSKLENNSFSELDIKKIKFQAE